MTPPKTTKPLDEHCQAFGRKLEESRLLSPEELAAAYEQLRRGRGKAHPVVVATWLVDQGHLSRWQAEQLLGGRTAFRLGRYKLIEKIGAGGMGAVYKAEQVGLGRIVAVKLMGQELLEKPGALDRFLREIQLVAKLQHPNIVSAYDADQVAGRHFLVLEYVEGQDLEQILQQTDVLPIGVACEVILQAARGLQHAFERGIVHRDIKPGNLLITQGAEGNFVVKILDMGLARFTRDPGNASLTKSGQIMGTPDYMAPEQVEDTRKVDTRADVYSLGSSLFEMLTGRPPFEGGSSTRRLMARLAGEAPRLRAVAPEMPEALDAVIARMIARNPEERYATPGEAAAALAPFAQEGSRVVIEAGAAPREASDTRDMSADISSKALGDLAGKTSRSSTSIGLQAALDKSLDEFDSLLQNLRATSAETTLGTALVQREEDEAKDWHWKIVAAAIAVLALTGGFGWHVLGTTHLAIDIPVEERTGLLHVDGDLIDFPDHGAVVIAGRPGERKVRLTRVGYHPVEATLSLSRGEELTFRPKWKPLPETSRKLAWTALEKEASAFASSSPLDPKLTEFSNRVLMEKAAQSGFPEAERAQSILSNLPSPLDLYEASTISPHAIVPPVVGDTPIVAVLGPEDSRRRFWRYCNEVHFAPDGKRLLAMTFGASRLIDVDTNATLYLSGPAVYSGAFSSDGRTVVVGESSGAYVCNADTGERHFAAPGSHCYCVQYSPDNRHLLVGSSEGQLSIWAAERSADPKPIMEFPKQPGNIVMARYSPDGKSVFSCCELDFAIRQYDVATGALLRTLQGHDKHIYEFAISRQGVLASVSLDTSIRLWDITTGKMIRLLSGSTGGVTAVAFTPDGRRLITADSTYNLRLWDVESGKLLDNVPGHRSTVYSIAVSPNGATVASVGGDEFLRTWTLENDSLRQTAAKMETPWILSAAISGDGGVIAAGVVEGDVLIWEAPALQPRSLYGHAGRVNAAQFAPFGRLLATGGYDYRVILWDGAKEWSPKTLTGHKNYVRVVAFSGDGRFLASADSAGKICIWNVETGTLEREIVGHEFAIQALAWRPDGRTLASSDTNYEIKVWKVDDGTMLHSRRYPQGGAGSLSVSPDGATLAFPAHYDIRRRYFADNHDEVLMAGDNLVFAIAIAPRGQTFAYSDLYGRLRVRKADRGASEISNWSLGHYYGSVKQLTYSTNGRYILTTNANGTAYLLRVGAPN